MGTLGDLLNEEETVNIGEKIKQDLETYAGRDYAYITKRCPYEDGGQKYQCGCCPDGCPLGHKEAPGKKEEDPGFDPYGGHAEEEPAADEVKEPAEKPEKKKDKKPQLEADPLRDYVLDFLGKQKEQLKEGQKQVLFHCLESTLRKEEDPETALPVLWSCLSEDTLRKIKETQNSAEVLQVWKYAQEDIKAAQEEDSDERDEYDEVLDEDIDEEPETEEEPDAPVPEKDDEEPVRQQEHSGDAVMDLSRAIVENNICFFSDACRYVMEHCPELFAAFVEHDAYFERLTNGNREKDTGGKH